MCWNWLGCAISPIRGKIKHSIDGVQMTDLKSLIAGYAQAGQVTWIGVRPARRLDLRCVPEVAVGEAGLAGDHARPGKRAVTLIQAEHLPVIGAMLGHGAVAPERMRRNLVVSGINLAALKGRHLRIGTAVLSIDVICAPCSRMEETLGKGGYSAVRGHGGWCASVVSPGQICVGDAVTPV